MIISIEDGHEEYVEFPYFRGIDKGDILTVNISPFEIWNTDFKTKPHKPSFQLTKNARLDLI